VQGRVVLITGGSSGIGLAAAKKIAAAGAKVLIVARDPQKLAEAKKEIAAQGAVFTYQADIGDEKQCSAFVASVLKEHGQVDILVNNAGRSIRRAIESSYERFHDFERTMQVNYFGALRLTLALLPSMVRRRRGHIINISSIGVLTNAPRFSAYIASKAALDAFSRCAASEYADTGVKFTTINMPLVKTPMIAPTKIYQNVPVLIPDAEADMIADAIVHEPMRIATRLGIFGEVIHALLPRLAQIIMNTSFRMFPESAAAAGKKEGEAPPQSADQIAFSQLMRGIHF
jgi:NAD(P)-dependent dehydrogenase (short-subunit alcohol dehydrogenase family)